MSKEQLFQILSLPDDALQQVLDYASTLSKGEAAQYFTDMLGDSPQVIEFISTFNSRRSDPKLLSKPPSSAPGATPSSSHNFEVEGVPKHRSRQKKQKPSLHTPPPRQVASFEVAAGTVYNKKDLQQDYIPPARSGASTPSISDASYGKKLSISSTKIAPPPPPTQQSKPPPLFVAGTLVSELGLPKQKSRSNPSSRTATPGPSSSRNNNAKIAKVSITGGVPMHGQSTALADFDEAIRALEISTNPTHFSNTAKGIAARRCNCVATRHPLLEAAPNCLNCGKVICIKEGLGPCTFCGQPLLNPAEVQSMIKELRQERGREKMAADREAHKKTGTGGGQSQRSYANPLKEVGLAGPEDLSVAEAMARQHRDKLLAFQAQNAKRTTVKDEAADFDPSLAGSMWATPEERAMALKRQQKLMREMEWSAKPEYEKRQQIISIDITGKKVFKQTVNLERPPSPDNHVDTEDVKSRAVVTIEDGGQGHGGAYSKNPLLGGLIRPIYEPKGKQAELPGKRARGTRWRRVQDDLDDNEAVILDGGIRGERAEVITTTGDEPACG